MILPYVLVRELSIRYNTSFENSCQGEGMGKNLSKISLSTITTHLGEGNNPFHAHVTPIYQTSTFGFSDVDSGAKLFKGELPGYIYTRMGNPNFDQLALKYAAMEGLDLLNSLEPNRVRDVVDGYVFSSGMAAITTAIFAKVKAGQTILSQEALYGATFTFLHDMAARLGVKTVFLKDISMNGWKQAFKDHPEAVLAYAETPANPTMAIIDLKSLADLSHEHGAWLMVDNTFATPYCQRPLTLGADVVIHSTTKYLTGHGSLIGGTVISRHVDWVKKELYAAMKVLGGNPSPFDAWLANIGLKTFELRMKRHCENTMQIAEFLEEHPAVEKVFYPGLSSHPDHELAKKQMTDFSGMLSFEMKGGFEAGKSLMNKIKLMTLAVSLGNVDTLIQHPASMTHAGVPREERLATGLTDGLVRLSVGIEEPRDIIKDLNQAMSL